MRKARLTVLFLMTVLAAVANAERAIDLADVVDTARDVTGERYPNADDVVVAEHVHVAYQADGTSVTIDDEYVKLLTEKGKRGHQSLSYHFTLPYGTVTITKLEIIKPDGSVVPIDHESQSRVMVSRSQMNANIYNPNRKILRVGVPGLEVGDICHITVRTEIVKPRVPDTWSDYSVFEYTTPIEHIVYEVDAPSSLPLQNIALKADVPGTVVHTREDAGERIRYRWEVRDVPRTFAEPNMPAMYTVVQRLLVSTIPDWEHISRWYWNLCLPHLETVNDAMRAKVQELSADSNDRMGRIEAIFQFVSQQIRYMGITTEKEAPGYEPHDVSVTFDNRYGVCRDKAALLVAMLRLADVPAYPVIIQAGPKKDAEVPQPYFNHAIVAAEAEDGDYILMDPTDENTTELLPAYLCNRSYLVAHPEGEGLLTSPIIPAESNMLHIVTEADLAGDGTLTASTSLRFEGINDNAYRGYFARLKPVERKRFFEGALKRRVAGATLKNYSIEPEDIQDTARELVVELAYEAADFPVGSKSYSVLSPPWLGTTLGYANFVLGRTGLDERTYPLETEIACGVSETFSLTVADALGEVIGLPDYRTVDTGEVRFQANIEMQDGVLSGRADFKIQAVEFSPEEYRELKQALRDIEYERRKTPLFNSDEAATEHDVVVLSSERVIELSDSSNWTDTRRVRKRILTYAGKKQNSELKLSFNPVWETVELRHALVTMPTGETREVIDDEVNVMDASWVGSAPRYSPGRTMVVSLPGVEVGGLVEYEVVRRKTARPFFSTVVSFAAHNPVLTNRLEIRAPEAVGLKIVDEAGGVAETAQTVADGVVSRTWEAVEQPVIPKEDGLPPRWSFTPTVMVSGGAWEDYADDVFGRLTDASTVSEAIREATRAAIDGRKGAEDQVVAIRDYVARNIRRAGPGLTAIPLDEISTAERTLQDGYGNSADRAVLLQTMLSAAGYDPSMLLAASRAPQKASLFAPLYNVPQRGLYSSVLVEVDVGGEAVLLGDTDQYAKLGSTAHHAQPGLTADGWLRTVAATGDCTPKSRRTVDITVDEDGTATISENREFRAMSYASFHRRFAELPPEERRRYYLELLGGLSQSAVAKEDLVTDYGVYPGRQTYTAEAKRYAVRSGDHLLIDLPIGIPSPVALRSATRTQPLYRRARLDTETTYRVFLPANTVAIPVAPEDLAWTAPAGLGSVTIDVEATASPADGQPHVTIKHSLQLAPAVVPAHDYASLLDMNRKLQHKSQRTLLIQLNE